MKKMILIGALAYAALFCFAMSVNAADLAAKNPPMAAPLSWAGLYITGEGVYGANITDPSVLGLGDVSSIAHGPGLKGSVGYNFQPVVNGWVFGVRADIGWLNVSGAGTIADLSMSNATHYLGDFDGVLLIPLSADGRLAGYGVAGFAYGGAKSSFQVATLAAAESEASAGWNAGLGLAYQLNQNWFVKMEGDYYALGDKSLTLPGGVMTANSKFHIITQTLGLGVKF